MQNLTFSPQKNQWEAVSSWFDAGSKDDQRDSTLTLLISLIFTAESTLIRLIWVRVESNWTYHTWVGHNSGSNWAELRASQTRTKPATNLGPRLGPRRTETQAEPLVEPASSRSWAYPNPNKAMRSPELCPGANGARARHESTWAPSSWGEPSFGPRARRAMSSDPNAEPRQVLLIFRWWAILQKKRGVVWTTVSEYLSLYLNSLVINPRPTGTPDFPPPQRRGGGVEHPRLSRLLLVVEKNEKNVRKLVKNDYETISVNFSLMSKFKNGQIFEFSRLSNIVSENLHYLGNY